MSRERLGDRSSGWRSFSRSWTTRRSYPEVATLETLPRSVASARSLLSAPTVMADIAGGTFCFLLFNGLICAGEGWLACSRAARQSRPVQPLLDQCRNSGQYFRSQNGNASAHRSRLSCGSVHAHRSGVPPFIGGSNRAMVLRRDHRAARPPAQLPKTAKATQGKTLYDDQIKLSCVRAPRNCFLGPKCESLPANWIVCVVAKHRPS